MKITNEGRSYAASTEFADKLKKYFVEELLPRVHNNDDLKALEETIAISVTYALTGHRGGLPGSRGEYADLKTFMRNNAFEIADAVDKMMENLIIRDTEGGTIH